jgi:hypothetical protein
MGCVGTVQTVWCRNIPLVMGQCRREDRGMVGKHGGASVENDARAGFVASFAACSPDFSLAPLLMCSGPNPSPAATTALHPLNHDQI